MIAQVVGHRLAPVEHLLDARVGDVACDDKGSGEGYARLHRERGQLTSNVGHGLRQIDTHDFLVVRVLNVG